MVMLALSVLLVIVATALAGGDDDRDAMARTRRAPLRAAGSDPPFFSKDPRSQDAIIRSFLGAA